MKKKLIDYWEIFIIFLFSLTPLLWLKDNQVIIGHDSGFRLNIFEYFKNLFYSWSPLTNFGVDWSIFKGFLIAQLPETLFISITRSLANGERLTFIFWFFVMGISMYVFINNFFSQKKFWIFRLFSSTFYMYNFFLLQGWFIVERAKFSLFAVLPLGFLIIYKLLKKEYSLLKGTIIFSFVFLFLNGGGNPTFYGALILVYFVAFLYLTFINYLRHGIKEIFFSIKTILILVIAVVLVNTYWILPQIYLTINKYALSLISAGGISGILRWEGVVNKDASFINLFRLQGIPDWYNNINNTYSNYFINNFTLIFLSFIPIFVILFGLIFYKRFKTENRNDELFYLIFLIFLVGIVFTAGSHPPLGFLYNFLVEHIPGFAIFRSAFYKFGPAYWFSFIFLTGYLLNLLLLNIENKKYIYSAIGIIAILFILGYHFPYFTSNFFEFNKPFTTKITIPNHVKDASVYINTKTLEDSRILILPKLDPNFRADSYDWGFFSLDILPRLSTNRSIIANDNSSPEIIKNIYDSIETNDETMFLKLTGLTGIDKILWRDDVLYSDEITRSSDLRNVEEIIKNFESVLLEKEFDKWKIYKIDNPYYRPLFHIPEKVVLADSEPDIIGGIFSLQNEPGSNFIFSNNENQDLINKLDILVNSKYFQIDCAMCNLDATRNIVENIRVPIVRFLPDSPFYPLVSWKEQKLFEQYKNVPSQRIDTDLDFASKRLGEIRQILFRDYEINSEELIRNALKEYKLRIDDAISQANKLSEIDKNNFLIKISAFLRIHDGFLRYLSNKDNILIYDFEDLSIFIKGRIADLESNIWISTANNEKKIIFNIDKESNYDLVIRNQNISPQKIQLDGKEMDTTDNLYLTKGIHKLEIVYPISKSPSINGGTTGSEIIKFSYGEKKSFPIPDYNYQYRYVIKFEYKIDEGKGPDIILVQDNDRRNNEGNMVRVLRDILNGDGEWHDFEYSFTPNLDAKEASINFQLLAYNARENIFQIRDFSVDKIFNPQVFLRQNTNNEYLSMTDVVFKKINSTKYTVQVTNANDPYILSFGESFDKEWKAYISDDKKLITENNHLKINGYANGWFIDKEGNYDIIIEYWPQKVFHIGLLISGVSMTILILVFLFTKKNGKDN